MRMWMIDPKLLCRQHLLGEHVELHMLVGHLARKRRLGLLAEYRYVEPTAIVSRHEAVAYELGRRGMDHQSPLEGPLDLDHLDEQEFSATIDKAASVADLLDRCELCGRRIRDEMMGEEG